MLRSIRGGGFLYTHLLWRRGNEDWVAIEYAQEDGDKMVEKNSILLALTITLDVVTNFNGMVSLCPKICVRSASSIAQELAQAIALSKIAIKCHT